MVKKKMNEFKDQLKAKQLKQTKPREIIVDVIMATKQGDHFTADDLWDRLREKETPISKATVYRTLKLLVEEKIIEEHDFGRGQSYYERMVSRPHHDHIICVHCGRIIEFHNDEIEQIQKRIAKKLKFNVYYHSHKLFGACDKCSKKK